MSSCPPRRATVCPRATFTQCLGHGAQDTIADRAAVLVVDRPEPVHVDERDRAPGRSRSGPGQATLHSGTVQQARQAVARGVVMQRVQVLAQLPGLADCLAQASLGARRPVNHERDDRAHVYSLGVEHRRHRGDQLAVEVARGVRGLAGDVQHPECQTIERGCYVLDCLALAHLVGHELPHLFRGDPDAPVRDLVDGLAQRLVAAEQDVMREQIVLGRMIQPGSSRYRSTRCPAPSRLLPLAIHIRPDLCSTTDDRAPDTLRIHSGSADDSPPVSVRSRYTEVRKTLDQHRRLQRRGRSTGTNSAIPPSMELFISIGVRHCLKYRGSCNCEVRRPRQLRGHGRADAGGFPLVWHRPAARARANRQGEQTRSARLDADIFQRP